MVVHRARRDRDLDDRAIGGWVLEKLLDGLVVEAPRERESEQKQGRANHWMTSGVEGYAPSRHLSRRVRAFRGHRRPPNWPAASLFAASYSSVTLATQAAAPSTTSARTTRGQGAARFRRRPHFGQPLASVDTPVPQSAHVVSPIPQGYGSVAALVQSGTEPRARLPHDRATVQTERLKRRPFQVTHRAWLMVSPA